MVKILKNKWLWGGAAILAIVAFLFCTDTGRRFNHDTMAMGAGVGAKLACSGIYLMGRDPDEVVKRDLRPFMDPLLKSARFEFDAEKQTATATMWGLVTRTALYRPGVGCTIMIDTDRAELLAQAEGIKDDPRDHRPAEWPAGDVVTLDQRAADIDWQQLDKAIDGAFEDTTENKTIDTRAILVVYDGKIIAERYADGFNDRSRFLSWSASKSVASALIGTLVSDGKLGLHDPAPIAEWSSEDDPRHEISLHHLLTMTSGLEFVEHPYSPGNDSVVMLFEKAKMGEYAANKPLFKTPGTFWAYSSGTTNLLSRILFDQLGGSLKLVHDYSWARFFKPAGMTSAIFETDAAGAHVGSSSFYATAQDWARFGLLFLNEGRMGDQQVLSKEWVAYSHRLTPLAPKGMYGAQFWLNGGHPSGEGGLMMPDCPKDLYMANGFNGQHIAIVPSKNAVVVRLGWTNGARFDTNKYFSEILKAIPTQ